MSGPEISNASTTGGLPIAPSMGPVLEGAHSPRRVSTIDRRTIYMSMLAILLSLAAGVIAQVLSRLIALVTNFAFYGRVSAAPASPAGNTLGWTVILVPVAGSIVVGLMARYGSKAIRGHGIPEAMEQILLNDSRIPARMTLLKPLSAAVAIGTGGPFGAEGPIIATGGALGSLVGQFLRITADERKTLLAAGAAAGMSATFGTPVSAVLLAIELLLFEYRPRSMIPVALGTVTAGAVRMAFVGMEPAFRMPDVAAPSGAAIAVYIALGLLVGVASVFVTRAVYAIEDGFERLPIHWMWWPALGGVAVGVVGYFVPRTMGVGYDNIDTLLSGDLAGRAALILCTMKFVSWSLSLGSGTSGGTLAPLFTIGGGVGSVLGSAALLLWPSCQVDIRVAALVGMAAMFAGASRALLASVLFAFEATRQPFTITPLLAGCSAAFVVSSLLMHHSIMTEKIVRRGTKVISEYSADFLGQILVRDCAARTVITVRADDSIASARSWLASGLEGTTHQGFPVLDANDRLVGVVTRRDLLGPKAETLAKVGDLIQRALAVAHEDDTAREAADHMVAEGVGRLPVVSRNDPRRVVGILTRSDLLSAHARRIGNASDARIMRTIHLGSRVDGLRRRMFEKALSVRHPAK